MNLIIPSNFIRIQKLYNNDLAELKKDFSSYSFSDEETRTAMKFIYEEHQYIAEPHGAIGFLGLQKEQTKQPDSIGVFLETAHPIRFSEIVEANLCVTLEIPKQIKTILDKKKISTEIITYEELKSYLKS